MEFAKKFKEKLKKYDDLTMKDKKSILQSNLEKVKGIITRLKTKEDKFQKSHPQHDPKYSGSWDW